MTRALLVTLVVAACSKSSESPAPPSPPSPKPTPTPAPQPPPPDAPAPTPDAAVAIALPGKCVDPSADTNATIVQPPDGVPYGVEEGPGFDIDGDGTPDRFVSIRQMMILHTRVYVMRGKCGHFVGDLGTPPTPVKDPTRSHGLLDLMSLEGINCQGEPCGCEPGQQWHRFDGTVYKLDKKASTESRGKPCGGSGAP